MGALLALVLALLGGLLLNMFSNELFAWLPRLNQWIVRAACLRFRDPSMGERFREEWGAVIAELPGPLVGLVHSLSLFRSVRQVERDWAAGLDASELQEHFAALAADIKRFGNRLATARQAAGLSLHDVATITMINVGTLRAFERGELNRIPSGLHERCFLRDFAKAIGLDPDEMWEMYAALFRTAGLPPASSVPRPGIFSRLACSMFGHEAVTKYFHADREPLHWAYRECERCGALSRMWSGPCHGRKHLFRADLELPLEEVYSCEDRYVSGWLSPAEEHAAFSRGLRVEKSRLREQSDNGDSLGRGN